MKKVKICGLFRQEDIAYVNKAMPDYIGFVFAQSRRQVSAEQASLLRKALAPGIKAVGVFVNEQSETVVELYNKGIIDIIQLHGNEDNAYIAKLKKLCNAPVIKAFNMDETQAVTLANQSSADFVLLDKGKGGTGRTFDWCKTANLTRPYFLAGGISLENIAQAKQTNAFCLDISSGAETNGVKDQKKILQLVASAHTKA